jgi:hypothetical protein
MEYRLILPIGAKDELPEPAPGHELCRAEPVSRHNILRVIASSRLATGFTRGAGGTLPLFEYFGGNDLVHMRILAFRP